MSFTVGQIELDMGTFRFFRRVMLSASILFIRGSVFGPSHLLVGFAGFMVSLSVSNRDGLMRIMHRAERSIIVRVNHISGAKGSNIFSFEMRTFITIFALRKNRNENIVISMKPNNPFLIAGYYSPEFFCDRVKETREISDALYNGRNVTLISPRRMGKTGLICHTYHVLKEEHPDIVTLYMDIFSTQSLSDFVHVFAKTVLGKLDIAPNEEENTLKEIFEYLASSEKRCYIAIDEFQQIREYPEKGVEALLRSYIQFLPNVNFIFAGSKMHMMNDMFMSSKKPFYHSTQIINITKIDREEYAKFASRYFALKDIKLPEKVFNYIYDLYDGHTWYIQYLLNRLYSYDWDVDMELVHFTIDQIVSEFSYSYANLMKSQAPGSVRLLKAIAKERCVKEIMSGSFIAKHKLKAASSVSSSLKTLIERELVYETDNGYIIYDRFMGEWLREQLF